MSGSHRTAGRRSPSRSIWPTRASRSWRRPRCSRSKAANTSGACASSARGRSCHRQRVRAAAPSAAAHVRIAEPALSGVLHAEALQQELRAASRFVYAQSHPDEDFAETFAVWLTPNSEWRQRYAGWRALGKLEYMDSLMDHARRRGAGAESRGDRSAQQPPRDIASALSQQAPLLRRGLPELLRSRSAAPVLRRAGVCRRDVAPQFINRIRRSVRRVVSGGPASTST